MASSESTKTRKFVLNFGRGKPGIGIIIPDGKTWEEAYREVQAKLDAAGLVATIRREVTS